jgi:enoyl-[acyl-carrier protein] reductase/trans-2-enoyl-CoA reductase (NAD+)
MIIKPKVRGFICTNAHPVGCEQNVKNQISHIKSQAALYGSDGPKNVLVIGSSTGYGLASRITAAFGYGAKTMGVFFEKPATERKTGSAGFYNAAAFDSLAKEAGLYARSFNGDAFSHDMKGKVIEAIKEDMGQVDLVVYSLASPRRGDPDSDVVYNSTLKPIGNAYTAKNLNTDTRVVGEVTVEPATDEEIANTVKVMGGEDWQLWIDALDKSGVLTQDCKTVAYTYIGDELTKPIYGHATIGKAKEHLDTTAEALNSQYQALGLQASVSVLKAVVTQASSAIPVMPLYLSILFKEMKQEGTHEGCIEQLDRLFRECVYSDSPRVDEVGRFRVDELELKPELQSRIEAIWPQVTTENLADLTDFEGYHDEFLKLFGFNVDGVDYDADVDPQVEFDFA